MKAIRMRIQKTSRPGVILMATVVAIITSMVAANATQTITAPNAVAFSPPHGERSSGAGVSVPRHSYRGSLATK